MCNELKPCPFCGSSLDIFFEDSYKTRLGCYCAELRCFRCGASIHGHGNTKEVSENHARHRWNTRVERTCHPVPKYDDDSPWPVMVCSECGRSLHYDETKDGIGYSPYCVCGARVVE